MALFRFQLRRGTAAQWTAANPVLADGEPGVETDTGALKIGDGAMAWAGLPYASDAEVAANINTPGSATAAALSDAIAAGARTLVGHGFPEGVVTASPGYRYVDLDATNGAVEWVKVTGTGNTGWQVAYGDTGVRDVRALYASTDFTFSTLNLRRVGAQITLYGVFTPSGVQGAYELLTLGDGFRPDTAAAAAVVSGYLGGSARGPVGTVVNSTTYANRGTFYVAMSSTTVQQSTFMLTYIPRVNEPPWPTALPGVPA